MNGKEYLNAHDGSAARKSLLNRDREGAVWAAFSTRTFAI